MNTTTAGDGTQIPAAGATFTPMSGPGGMYGGRRGSIKAKTLRRMLKKAGLKTTGKKATLTRRAKKAHLRGGSLAGGIVSSSSSAGTVGGRHRRTRGGSAGLGGAGNYPFNTGDVGTGGGRRRRPCKKHSTSSSESSY
jgi:hypothetical protein